MNILPILNYPSAWGHGSTRAQTIGTIFFQSGTHINPDITIGNRHDMIVSAIIRADGTFELEIKTHHWEDGLGAFQSYDTVDDIIHVLKKKSPAHLVRHFEGKAGREVRKWAVGVLREVGAIEEGQQ